MLHGYSDGVRTTSQYDGMTFKSLDLTVDARTGVPRASRDVAEIETTMKYDVLGRKCIRLAVSPGRSTAIR